MSGDGDEFDDFLAWKARGYNTGLRACSAGRHLHQLATVLAVLAGFGYGAGILAFIESEARDGGELAVLMVGALGTAIVLAILFALGSLAEVQGLQLIWSLIGDDDEDEVPA